VTFLFTDIAGSTRLLRELGNDRYAPVLERHGQLLRSAVDRHGGVFVDGEGDGLFFAFESAKSALSACIDGQELLLAEPWPYGANVRVRMGLHTGEAAPLNGTYVAISVHRASRTMSAAHGGQIIASQATAAAASEALPELTSLLDLGEFTLKDFEEPVHLYQVCHPSLPEDFEPPNAEPVRRSREPGGVRRAPAAARSNLTPEQIASYRSPGTPAGAFRVPGEIHVHIDGGTSASEIYATLCELEGGSDGGTRPRFPMKFNAILRFSAGPQRDDRAFVQTYRYHTPGIGQRESFETFSTMLLGDGSDLDPEGVGVMETILHEMHHWSGAVVELERVIGVLQPGGRWEEADPPRIADPNAFDNEPLQQFPRLATSPIEIHHSIDFPKGSGDRRLEPVLGVDELPTWPNLGGWFLFDRGDTWSYRSSEFVDRSGEYRYAACVGQARLLSFLEGIQFSYELHTLAEQVLGIWRGGTQPAEERSTVPALGEWEMSCPPGGHIWVIAPNFFGDRSPDVRRAMVRNLSQDVTYTYFLRSHADILRLSRLAQDLERDLMNRGKTADGARRIVSQRVRCLLLDPALSGDERLKCLLGNDYFLCPTHADMGGFQLDSSGFSGERVETEDYDYLVQVLGPLLGGKAAELLSTAEGAWAARSSRQVVVCTEFEGSAVDQDQDSWRDMLSAYDRIVAGQVSMHGAGCVVVRPVRNGYLLVFDEPRQAGEWARRLQFEIQWHNDVIGRRGGRSIPIPTHNIALAYGSVTRILRAHGYDYVGGSIDECIRLADSLRGGQIAMSRIYADQYEASVGKNEFAATTREETDYLIGELRLLEWP
jgi:class 3 adenylate cyclase